MSITTRTTTAAALVVSGVTLAAYPALRPYGPESGMAGAADFGSTAWLAAHVLGMVGFVSLAFALRSAAVSPPWRWSGQPVRKAETRMWLAVALLLPYYGAEAYGLNELGRYATEHGDAGVLDVADAFRYAPFEMTTFALGLLPAGHGRRAARARSVAPRPARAARGGILAGLGLATYLPQFFGGPEVRIAHGVVLGLGLVLMAWPRPGVRRSCRPRRGRSVLVRASGSTARCRQELGPGQQAAEHEDRRGRCSGFIPNLRARPEQTPAMTRLSGTDELAWSWHKSRSAATGISAPRRPFQGRVRVALPLPSGTEADRRAAAHTVPSCCSRWPTSATSPASASPSWPCRSTSPGRSGRTRRAPGWRSARSRSPSLVCRPFAGRFSDRLRPAAGDDAVGAGLAALRDGADCRTSTRWRPWSALRLVLGRRRGGVLRRGLRAARRPRAAGTDGRGAQLQLAGALPGHRARPAAGRAAARARRLRGGVVRRGAAARWSAVVLVFFLREPPAHRARTAGTGG